MTPRNEKGAGRTPQRRTRSRSSIPTRTASESKVPRLDDVRPAQLEAWAVACWHLWSLGLPPLPPVHIAAALRRRGMWPASHLSPDRPLSDTRTM